jgi:hypothetical protein
VVAVTVEVEVIEVTGDVVVVAAVVEVVVVALELHAASGSTTVTRLRARIDAMINFFPFIISPF